MATELNLDVIRGMGFDVPGLGAERPRRRDPRATRPASPPARQRSTPRSPRAALRRSGAGGFGEAPAARTLGGAIQRSGADLALVSVPGEHAVAEALDAVRAGISVMVFSDNVPVEDEVRLKDAAAAADVLVMGPDCGTAVVGGVALGFANVVRPGSVGLVAASGTGAQQVMCLLDAAGVGISHCLGVGGRDLSVRRRRPLDASRRSPPSPPTRRPSSIVVVSKPPAPEVLADLEAYAAGLGKPVHWATLGPGRPDLTAAVESVLAATGHEVPSELADVGVAGAVVSDPEVPCCAGTRCAGSSAAAPSPTRRCSWPARCSATSSPTPRSGRSWRSGPTCATPATSSSTSATTP